MIGIGMPISQRRPPFSITASCHCYAKQTQRASRRFQEIGRPSAWLSNTFPGPISSSTSSANTLMLRTG
jgi:hypothetical protein